MAKVYMPLMSAQASGKLADAMVHFYWKGLNVVRQYVIPTNPQSIDQKLARQKLASMGKNLLAIKTPESGLLAGSKMYQLLVDITPANNIWNAYFVKKGLEDITTDIAFTTLSAGLAASGTFLTVWQTTATGLGFANLTGTQYATAIAPELQFFMGAYAAYKLNLCSKTSHYSTYPSTWDTATIKNFGTDYYTTC